MGLLLWAPYYGRPDGVERVMSTEDWKNLSADSAPPGVYTPNMRREDMCKWKAKHVRGKDPRVEIRKTAGRCVQVLIVVRDESVKMSMNGTAEFTSAEFDQLDQAVGEARFVLEKGSQRRAGNCVCCDRPLSLQDTTGYCEGCRSLDCDLYPYDDDKGRR
jgi:hypothetical protein